MLKTTCKLCTDASHTQHHACFIQGINILFQMKLYRSFTALAGKIRFCSENDSTYSWRSQTESKTQYSSSDSKLCTLMVAIKHFWRNLTYQHSHPSGEKSRGRWYLPSKQCHWLHRLLRNTLGTQKGRGDNGVIVNRRFFRDHNTYLRDVTKKNHFIQSSL